MRFRLPCLAVFVCLAHFTCHLAAAQQWTRFRGPNGSGIGRGDGIPSQWTELDYNWKVALPGVGHSSPVLWGDKIFLLSADPEDATRFVLCLNAPTGSIRWVRQFRSTPHHLNRRNSYASCTPAVDAQRVYVAWSTPEQTTLKALDHEGRDVWSLDLGRWQSQHGFGTSPILFEDLVILHNSQQAERLRPGEKPGQSFMMAFDCRTGRERWRRPLTTIRVCYSVPCIYQPENGPPQLVCCSTGDGIFSLDPRTGRWNWKIDVFKMRTVASPIVASGLILGSTGSGGGGNYVVAVRPGAPPEVVYQIKTAAGYVPTPVTNGQLVFIWYDKGVVTCIDGSSGRVYWRQRVGGNFYGSPVRVGNRLFCVSEAGQVVVLAAEKQFRQLGRNPLGEDSRSTPAVAGGRMYLRTYSHLISIGGKSS